MLEPRNKSLVFAIALSLSPLLVYILHAYYCLYLYLLDIHIVLHLYMLGDCLLTLVFNQESQRGTSTLI